MKRITLTVAGIGLATAALSAVATPAFASELSVPATPSSTVATGDRVTGQVELWGRNASALLGANPSDSTGSGTTVLSDAAGAGQWELPALGKTGPITGVGANEDLCLTDGAPSAARWESCGGYPTQQWTLNWIDNVGNGSAHSGYMIQPASDSTRWLHDLGTIGQVATGSITGTRPERGIVIDNYSALTPVVSNATAVALTGPTDSEVTLRNPTFTGTGDEGAQINVHDETGAELCRTTVNGGGWTCSSVVDLLDGPLDVTVTQLATDNTTSTTSVSFVVADPNNTPVVAPIVASGVVALLAAAGTGMIVRHKRTDA